MGFESILDLNAVPEREGGRPAFYEDLNLNQVIERICVQWEKNVSAYYYYLPANRLCEDYRREVFADVKKENVYELLCGFVKQMKVREEACLKGGEVHGSLQKATWFMGETYAYCEAFLALYEAFQKITFTSRGMQRFMIYLNGYLESSAFKSLYETVCRLKEVLDSFRVRFVYENDRITVMSQSISTKEKTKAAAQMDREMQDAYDVFLRDAFPAEQRKMKSPFEIGVELSELEIELMKLVRKQNPEFFEDIKKFHKNFEDYADEVLLRFVSEIEFYLSFYCFEKNMQECGYDFASPVCVDTQMQAYGLYDLALACAHGSGGKKVIPNDMSYLEGEKIFVLTGPNQGGKTTFARSLGQLIYFTKMGLDVPAKSAQVPYFGEILTHFSVEESVETGRGKLKEELVRLKPMMDSRYENAFVIINELFTTAANYDACIMGHQVLEHFLEQKCQGIYVTHLKELAEPHPGIVSLRAMLDGNGKQSFEILRSPAVESANAINQVNKYRLTYEQLKERLS